MCKLVHSFWTRPSMISRYGYKCEQLFYNLWYFALSVAYAKKIGAKIVLHTDTLGNLLFGHLPYDSIYTTLDNIEVPPRFWAAGKFYALKAEKDLKAIHIDGDVFIKKPELWESMKSSQGDILVQYIEPWLDTGVRDKLAQYMNKDYFWHTQMYNTGVLGIFNQELKNKILKEYFNSLQEASKNLPQHLLDNQNFTPDLVCEQQMISYMCKDYIPNFILSDAYKCTKEANEIGYQHVLSTDKFNMLDTVKKVLKKVDLEIYNSTLKICQNL